MYRKEVYLLDVVFLDFETDTIVKADHSSTTILANDTTSVNETIRSPVLTTHKEGMSESISPAAFAIYN